MTASVAALSGIRFLWHGFRRLPSSHRHRDAHVAQRLLDAAAAEPKELLKQLDTTNEGLTSEAAATRLSALGPNLVAHERQQTVLEELIGRAKNPLNFLLLTLAAVSYSLGDTRAAAVIAGMVVLSVSLAFVQEHRSNNAAARLRAMVRTTATALRPGTSDQSVEIPIEELVPGDVVRLSAGDMIPADLRVLTAKDLFLNEATLTGEAMPVEKSAAPVQDHGGAPTDLPNIGFMGSNVLSGAATAIVVQCGAGTYFGELAGMLTRQRAETSFDKGVTRFGFLGDGINDGPALKSADVGISVDTAVDIAKESADIILLEKSLMVLSEGVLEGRKIFGNIVKYIKMGASSNFGNMLSVLGASIFLPFLPMAPIQVLTNNLLYDFSQTTIPTDNVDDEYIAAPRRWDIGNITKFMLCLGPISSIFDYVTYGTLLFAFNAWTNPSLFQTGWFVESLLTQTLIIHIIRTAKIPFLQSRASMSLITTTILVAGAGALLPYSQLGPTLGFVPLPGAYWPVVFAIILGYCVLAHLVKTWFVRRWGM